MYPTGRFYSQELGHSFQGRIVVENYYNFLFVFKQIGESKVVLYIIYNIKYKYGIHMV